LQDLGFGQPAGKALAPESVAWIAGDVSGEEVSAVIELLRRLSAGERSAGILGDASGSATLLRHWLAGCLDADYAKSLKLGRRLEGSRGRNPLLEIVRTAWRAVWLSNHQVEILYGRPGTAMGYLGWRLWRPFELVGRTLSSAAAWLRLQRPK
jgi:hypothetical protein